MNGRARAFLLALASAALFGMATPFSKRLLDGLQENQLAGLLYFGAALFLLPSMARQWRKGETTFPKNARNRLMLLGAIFFGGVLGPVLLLIGLRFSQAASVSMWLNLETVATAVFAVLFFREHLGRWTWLGNAGVLVAGVLLSLDRGWAGLLGVLCVGAAGVSWGLDNNLTATIDGVTPQSTTFWKGLVAGLVNIAIGFSLFPTSATPQWLPALILGGLAYGASIVLYISSAQVLGATRSQMVFACSPFFGVLLSVVWLGEGMSLLQVLAFVILVGGLALLLIEQHAHEHAHRAAVHVHEHRHDDLHHDHVHEGLPPEVRHAHEHAHEAVVHAHPHWPDLHHRHVH